MRREQDEKSFDRGNGWPLFELGWEVPVVTA